MNGEAAALAYAAAGWPVFPCKPDQKAPDTAHGFKDATTDPAVIRRWWRPWPDRNVAIATGAPGPDVLDVDVKPDGSGFPAFNRLKRAGVLAGARALVRTPSGGLHAYFAGTGQPCGRLPCGTSWISRAPAATCWPRRSRSAAASRTRCSTIAAVLTGASTGGPLPGCSTRPRRPPGRAGSTSATSASWPRGSRP